MNDPAKCEHENFDSFVDIARMPEVEGGPITRFSASVRIRCSDCNQYFRFIGLPAGLDLNGAAVSIDATEARLAIGPKGKVVSVLDGDGVTGFSIRKKE